MADNNIPDELPDGIGNSYPLMNLAKLYNLNYDIVLLFADSMRRDRHYSNYAHEDDAYILVVRKLANGDIFARFRRHVALILKRIDPA